MALVMGFIVISFAIWGIGDVFRGFSTAKLAKVGSGEVSVEAYRAAYQNEIRRLQQRTRRAIAHNEARQLGVDLQVLERLVTDASLDQKAKALGLSISEDEAAKLLKEEPAFQGVTGKFDADRFRQIVRDAGYTERSFLLEQKGDYLRREITDAITTGMEPPRIMLEALHRFRNEARAIDYVVLPAAAAGQIAAPSEDELKKYYADREQSFRAKEYRKLTILAVTPTTLAKPADVSDADVRKLYEEVKTKRFGAPEKREVRQIVFETEKEAQQALARLKNGLSFEALAAERKLTEKDIDLGLIEARDLGDQKLAAAVFALAKPGFADPVQTPFGAVLSEVRRIAPSVLSKSFEEASNELRREIATQRSAPEVRKLHDAIEEQRTSGKPLAEAAKSVGLEVTAIDATDAGGRDKSGKDIGPLFGDADVLKAAFASDVGVDNDTAPTKDGGYVWFEVAGVEPARQRSFEEVKDAAAVALRADNLQKALAAKATDLTEKLGAGKSLEDIAKDLGLKVEHAGDVKRAARPDLAPAVVVQFFDVPLHGAGSVAVGGGRLVFVVRDVALPAFDPATPEARAAAEQMKAALANDILEQYVGGLEKILGVDINQKALAAATGADQEQ